MPMLAVHPPRPALSPIGVFPRGYLRGFGDASVSRGPTRCIQRILRMRPYIVIVVHGSRLWGLVFYVSFDPAVKAQHVVDYLVAMRARDLTCAQLGLWLQLLRSESYGDFASPRLWRVLYPGHDLPLARPQ